MGNDFHLVAGEVLTGNDLQEQVDLLGCQFRFGIIGHCAS